MTKVTVAQIAKALAKHNGIILKVAEDLKVDRKTVTSRIARTPKLQELVERIDEEINDIAVENITNSIRKGNVKDSQWWLVQKAKHRGFGRLALEDDQLEKLVGAFPPDLLKKIAEG